MLEKIYIDGFRHFKNFSLEPYEQNTLLSGLNGTGKSSIVEIINKLQLFLINGLPVSSLCEFSDIPKWEIKEYGAATTTLGFIFSDGFDKFVYQLEIKHNFKERICRVQKESLHSGSIPLFISNEGNAETPTDDNRVFVYPVDWSVTGLMVAERNSKKIRNFIKLVKNNLFAVSLNPRSILSMHQDSEPVLNLDGSNFSAWYDFLLGEKVAIVASTFLDIKSFVPGFTQFIFEKDGKNKELIADISISQSKAYRLQFDSLSDGQKILCILHILIKIAPSNSTIIIDEFENFLSPAELQPLYDASQDAFEERNVQFIFISHHHQTMNWFQDDAVILSFSGSPAFVTTEKFIAGDGLSIDEHLIAKIES